MKIIVQTWRNIRAALTIRTSMGILSFHVLQDNRREPVKGEQPPILIHTATIHRSGAPVVAEVVDTFRGLPMGRFLGPIVTTVGLYYSTCRATVLEGRSTEVAP